MTNRVQEDHKLIVGIEGSRSGDVPSHSPKDSIPGKRGIVYFNADGSSESTSGNTPGVDEEGNKEEGTTQPDAGGAAAGTSGGGYNSGNKAADAGLSDPYPVDDPVQPGSGIFGVDSMTLGDVVNGVTGLKDCATDQPVDVRFDGQFTAPDGWDNPEQGPIDSTYTAGYYWVMGNGGTDTAGSEAPTKAGALAAGIAQDWAYIELGGITCTATTDGYRRYWSEGGAFINEQCVRQKACEGSTAAYCVVNEEDLRPTEWPSEKPMQLSYNSDVGQYETHSMDGNVSPEYSQPTSSFQLCNEAGDPIKSYAQADGGQAIYNVTTGIATFIDSTGKVTGFGDAQSITNGQPR